MYRSDFFQEKSRLMFVLPEMARGETSPPSPMSTSSSNSIANNVCHRRAVSQPAGVGGINQFIHDVAHLLVNRHKMLASATSTSTFSPSGAAPPASCARRLTSKPRKTMKFPPRLAKTYMKDLQRSLGVSGRSAWSSNSVGFLRSYARTRYISRAT